MASRAPADTSGNAELSFQLNLVVSHGIAPVSFWLGVLYALSAASHLFLLPTKIAPTMSFIAASTAVILFSLSMIARRRQILSAWAHAVAATVIALAMLNTIFHLLLARDIQQTTNLMLTFSGAAFFLLSTRWFTTILAGGLIAWTLALTQISDPAGKAHFTFGMAAAIILSTIIHFVHVRTTKRFLRTQADEDRNRMELTALNSIITSITSSLDPNSVFQAVVDAVQDFMPHVNGATLQVLEGKDRLATRAWGRDIQPELLTFRAGQGIAGMAVRERRLVNVPDVNANPNFFRGAQKVGFQSLLAMPLLVGEKVVGVISVEATTRAAFGPDEERKIQLLAGYAAVAIENSRLYTEHALAEETLKDYTDHLQEIVESRTSELRTAQDKIFEQKGLEQEIDLARQVQASLLAQEIPQLDGYVFAATAIPARYVGGDFYDFFWKGNVCYVILADISGKGIPAAMLTSTARTLVRAAMKYESEPALILSDMQDAIYRDLSNAEMFGTFFAASLDPDTAAFTYANAGHTETIWWRSSNHAIERLPANGFPIGIVAINEISQRQILLCPGDLLIFYSDGITETFNPQEELFGVERLMKLVTSYREDSAHTLAQRILTEVDGFANGAPLADDLTLVVLKVAPRMISFSFDVDLERFDDAVRFIRGKVEPYGADFAYQVELAASEIITNIVKYAYRERGGELRGEILLQEEGITLEMYDDGESFDPAQLADKDLEQVSVGGYGMQIVRQIMDEVTYSTGAAKGNNCWRIVKRVTAGTA